MPVILLPTDIAAWLAPGSPPDDLAALLRPYAAGDLEAAPVSTLVNSPKDEVPDILWPIEVN
jgi:putative SOS response-associated peptidase YedK